MGFAEGQEAGGILFQTVCLTNWHRVLHFMAGGQAHTVHLRVQEMGLGASLGRHGVRILQWHFYQLCGLEQVRGLE